ncbi:(2Fe-2S)-binding protein [Halosimplex amylolyticum]|uniref:(2Fe-2S)-binding protein n=1 Tax=Halosimplex amylolyticum TaxID=3396616 RepID=UPI003F5759A1
MATHDITLAVNGREESLTVESRTLLVHALRDDLGYTGPNVGCESGKCGACTVELDGDAVKSCTVLAVQADGGEVTTAAGYATEGLDAVQRAFHDEHGLQCGYCTPGMLATTHQLLDENRDPSRAEIRRALKGNVCRCTGYGNIVDAVETAADRLRETDDEREDDHDSDADAGSSGEETDRRADAPGVEAED